MSSATNSRRNRTAPAAQTPANTDASPDETAPQQLPAAPDAPAPDETPATTADAPQETTDAPDQEPTPEPTTATPATESDETVTPSDAPEPDAPETETAAAQADADPAPDAPAEAAKPATQMFAEMLATATSATVTSLDDKLVAFATAITIARTETLRTIAARKDDEIIRAVAVSARPDSASGRGPTLAKVQGVLAMLLGGAGYVSHGNCHASTKRDPIVGHVVLPEAVLPFWTQIWTAMDAPFGPIRVAERTTKQINKDGVKAGTAQFKTGYEQENRLPRVNMMNTIANLANLVPAVPADDEAAITAMRDLIAATTAEFNRVTSVTYIPKGATYVITPDDRYAVKQELTTATA